MSLFPMSLFEICSITGMHTRDFAFSHETCLELPKYTAESASFLEVSPVSANK